MIIEKEVMATTRTSTVGKKGAVHLPARLRRRFGIAEGTKVIAEECANGILIRLARDVDLEIYTPERQAEFLLSTAVDAKDYAKAVRMVRQMGLDPARIRHRRPRGA
jgi:AbrB family looped-hinge helix DNA binding protein